LPLPIHHRWSYLAALLLLVVAGRRSLPAAWACLREGWRASVSASPLGAAWALLALGLASAGSWPPTMQFDDLAYHLGLPWQLMLHGRHALDVTHQVWALA